MLKFSNVYTFHDIYPNISIALTIFLTTSLTTASNEKSFTKLKII